MKKITDYSLYLVTSEEYANGRNTYEVAKEAIAGDIDILQMREKHAFREELVALGNKLAALCKENNVIFIVNDDPHLAKEVNADIVLIDENIGYKIASSQNLNVKRTLSLIIASKNKGYIDCVKPILDDMISKKRWISKNVYNEILKICEES